MCKNVVHYRSVIKQILNLFITIIKTILHNSNFLTKVCSQLDKKNRVV